MRAYSAIMTSDPLILERIFDRLVRTLSGGGPDQLRAPFTVSDIVQAFVPYRTYRHELGVDTIQDYEHALLELLAGERALLVCDPDTVAVIRQELASPDPDTGLLRRLQTAQVRMGAIRMPVHEIEPASPSTRSEQLGTMSQARAPLELTTDDDDSLPHRVISDAVAIGAVIDREDLERARQLAGDAAAPKAAAFTEDGDAESDAVFALAELPPVVADPVTDSATTETVVEQLPSLRDLPSQVTADPPATIPLHSMHGVTVANAQTLARITPLTVPSVYGDPIDFRGVRHAPVDVGGVIFLFGMVARELGFHVEAMTSGSPRCEAKRQLGPGRWARVRIDFEHESRQFRDAGRNPATCDVVVCWRDTWPDRPSSLEVVSLERVLPTLSSRE